MGEIVQPTKTKNPMAEPDTIFNYIDIGAIDNEAHRISKPAEVLGKDAPSRARKSTHKGDILFATTRPTLRNISVVENEYANLVCSTGFCVLRAAPKSIDHRFLFRYLITDFIQRQIDPLIRGAQYPAISDKDLLNCSIPLPPLPTQRRIVATIDAAFTRLDEAIRRQKENLARATEMKKAVLEEVFGGEGWEVKTIEEIAFIKGGKRLPKDRKLLTEKTAYPYIRVADFNEAGSIDVQKVMYLDRETRREIKNYIINPGDLYISIAGTIGRTGIIPQELEGANLTENAARLVYKNPKSVLNKYVYYFTISSLFMEQTVEATKTVAQPKLALTRLGKIEIPLPSLPTQISLTAHLNRAFAQIDALIQAPAAAPRPPPTP